MLKSIIWRIIGIFVLWVVSYIFTGSIPVSTWITVVHHTSFIIIYYLHERMWLKIKWKTTDKDKKLRSFVKGFVYEIIIAIPVLSLISFIFTGDLYSATLISIIYTFIKIIIYFIFERVWLIKDA